MALLLRGSIIGNLKWRLTEDNSLRILVLSLKLSWRLTLLLTFFALDILSKNRIKTSSKPIIEIPLPCVVLFYYATFLGALVWG